MAKSIPAQVNPDMLVWARERAGYDVGSAAGKLKQTEERLEEWETGERMPTLVQARAMANIYKKPLAVFFLPNPPEGYDVLREYRRLAGPIKKETPALRQALEFAEDRREIYFELARKMGVDLPSFEGNARLDEEPEEVAKRLRKYLGISWATQRNWSDYFTAFGAWRDAAERHGVVVFQAAGIEVEEMRGVVIPAQEVPVVLLNSADAPPARAFSLLHELAHLWLLNGGYTPNERTKKQKLVEQPGEVFANAVAAATLLPKRHILNDPDFEKAALELPKNVAPLKGVARHYWVSPEVVARRMVTLNRLQSQEYKKMRSEGAFASQTKQGKKDSGFPAPHILALSRAGRSFSRLVFEAWHRGQLTTNKLADLYGYKLPTLKKIDAELQRRAAATSPGV